MPASAVICSCLGMYIVPIAQRPTLEMQVLGKLNWRFESMAGCNFAARCVFNRFMISWANLTLFFCWHSVFALFSYPMFFSLVFFMWFFCVICDLLGLSLAICLLNPLLAESQSPTNSTAAGCTNRQHHTSRSTCTRRRRFSRFTGFGDTPLAPPRGGPSPNSE